MDTLQSLLIQNQSNLDKLRARVLCCRQLERAASELEDRLDGPFSEYWEEWLLQLETIMQDLQDDVSATALFVIELREFHGLYSSRKRLSKLQKAELHNMLQLAEEARLCQLDMLHLTDQQIADHKDFTQKLYLVEVMESLNED